MLVHSSVAPVTGKRDRFTFEDAECRDNAKIRKQDQNRSVEDLLGRRLLKKEFIVNRRNSKLYVFVVADKARSTYPHQDVLQADGYPIFSKSIGIDEIAGWGRLATEEETKVWEEGQPKPNPNGKGMIWRGKTYPEGNSWGPRGYFGPKWGSNFCGD